MSPSVELKQEHPRFGGKRWLFWPISLLPAVTVVLLHPCMEAGNWPAPTLLTVMLMASLWEAHAHALSLQQASQRSLLWQVCKRAFRNLLSLAMAALLSLFAVGLILPNYSCYSDQVRVAEAMAFASDVKSEIAHRATLTKILKDTGLGLALPKSSGKTAFSGFVMPDGVIILTVEKPPAAVLFTPKLVDAHSGAIEWSCRGYPAKSVPAQCREPE